MARRRRRRSSSLAAQAFALGVAAPQVIAHRVARMAGAGARLSARDRAEFHRMGIEKVAAAGEAWTAMAAQAMLESQKLALGFMRSPWLAWNGAAARILAKGMAPVSRRASANAKRLRRSKRK